MLACTTTWGGWGGRGSNISELCPTHGAVLSQTLLLATPASRGALRSIVARAAMQMT